MSTSETTSSAGGTGEGRPSTRDRILDAAYAIVAAHGVAAATTKRIASEAALSEGTLYNHFPDKPELLVALVLERLPSIRGIFQALTGDADTVPLATRLERAMTGMIAFYGRTAPIVGGIVADPDLLQRCRDRFTATGQGPQNAHEKLAAFLAAEKAAGKLIGVDPAILATMLIGACTEYASITHLTRRPPTGLSPAEYARAIVQTLAPQLPPPG